MQSEPIPEPIQYLRLDLEISIPYHDVLAGLEAWFEWELISEVDFRWRNDWRSPNRLMVVARQNEAMLQGLDLWLDLGLINDEQVRQICRKRLTCELKSEVTQPVISRNNLASSEPVLPSSNLSGSRFPRSVVASPITVVKPKAPQQPSKVAQNLRSLFSEFSTMWLLFLGVFLVVVSSGLLAASQWQSFSAQGQYLLLLSYTLGFFGVSFWTSQNERLRMTTRALQLVTLLLVPANFWAIDGLGLLTNPVGLGLGAIAGCLLSGIAIFLLQTSFVFRESQGISTETLPRRQAQRQLKRQFSRISIAAILFLSWLHLGWLPYSIYPLIAVYLGISGMAVSTFLNRRQDLNTADSSTFPLALITGAYSTVLLVSRALLFGNVSVFKLGLAFGICGWILIQITNKTASKLLTPSPSPTEGEGDKNFGSFQANLGQILLGLGWLVSVWDKYPWQTFIISLLIAWILSDRLVKLEKPIDLTYLFFWGLQILWLGQRLIPEAWQSQSTQQLIAFFQTKSELSLMGVFLFPYVVFALVVGAIYRDRQKNALAVRSELLALGFGVLLTTLSSIGHPATVFANLTLSAIALLVIQARRSATSKDLSNLVYSAHIISLSALITGIFLLTRSTFVFGWVGLLLVAVLIEWSAVLVIGKFSLRPSVETGVNLHMQAWRDSAWHIGATLAALSYILLWNYGAAGQNIDTNSQFLGLLLNDTKYWGSYWGVAWLCVPISLTFLGTWREFADRDLAIKLSIAGLAIAQLLTWHSDGSRLIGLGVAYALMLVNTRRRESLWTTLNTVGYGLLFIAAMLWQFKIGDGGISQFTFGVNGAIVSVLVLYVLNHWLKYRRDRHVANLNLPLNQSYSQAFDIWAALLSTALLILQTCLAILVFGFNRDNQLFINLLPSTILVALGMVYRIWQSIGLGTTEGPTQAPPFWTEWGIAWSVELLTSGAIAVTNGSAIELAIANLALGFFTQLLGDWWMKKTGKTEYPRSWDVIPLIYGVMGSLFRIGNFSNLSGLFSLSTSLIGIGIGRRSSPSNPIFKALTYLSMAIATFSAYELLFYQMVANSRGGSMGDGMVILAPLGCAIAYGYKIFANWIVPYLRLSVQEIGISAHLHWLASAVFLILGTYFNPSRTGGIIGVGIAIALAAYAIAQGRRSPLAPLSKVGIDLDSPRKSEIEESDLWVYTGITTAIGAIAYLIFFAFPNPWLIANFVKPYAAAIACVISAMLYLPPWQAWGWTNQPWHQVAFSLPLIFVLITNNAIGAACLLIVAAFYAIYANVKHQIRITYITVLLCDWAIFQHTSSSMYELSRFSFLINTAVIGGSGLYFTQVEPNLRSPHSKAIRHTLRSILSGGISLIAFLYSFSYPSIALLTWGLSSGFIIAGLGLRVRAYLFMGTLTFILLVLTQAVILVTQYSFLMWALGIFAGIGFIFVAANFEVRRDRILALFRGVAIELETWE